MKRGGKKRRLPSFKSEERRIKGRITRWSGQGRPPPLLILLLLPPSLVKAQRTTCFKRNFLKQSLELKILIQ